MTPQTIDEVLATLDQIILRARNERDRLGFFATLYRNVTLKVKEGIAAGLFADGPRMEKLDVTFANRYLAAHESFRQGEPLSRCWSASFRLAANWPPIILQHLLTGMNAHINFDLGIAAQSVAPGDELASLIKLLDRYASQTEDRLINFSLGKARASAWLVANMINTTPTDRLGRELSILDDGVAMLGTLIGSPKEWLISIGLHVIRIRESNDVSHIIDALSQM